MRPEVLGDAIRANSLPSIYAMNGKSVEVDNTDAEGRLVLSGEPSLDAPVCSADLRQDAIYYVSSHYKPHTLIDVATLTGYVIHGLKHGHCAYGLVAPWKSRWERSSAASSRCVFLKDPSIRLA